MRILYHLWIGSEETRLWIGLLGFGLLLTALLAWISWLLRSRLGRAAWMVTYPDLHWGHAALAWLLAIVPIGVEAWIFL